MTNTPYNQLRQILTDRLPHLKELSFGCEVGNIQKAVIVQTPTRVNEDRYLLNIGGTFTTDNLINTKIIGHPPTLQDVLLLFNQSEIDFFIDAYGAMYSGLGGKNKDSFIAFYDLTKPLADQSDETLLAIIELLR